MQQHTSTTYDNDMFIKTSIKNIDNFIEKNQYKNAFNLLILFLERLNNEDTKTVISYYDGKISA